MRIYPTIAAYVSFRVALAHWRGVHVGPVLKLVGWLSLADFLLSLKFLLSRIITSPSSTGCYMLAVLGQVTAMVTTSANFVIAVDVFLIFRDPFRHSSTRNLPRYLGFIVVVATVSAIVFAVLGAYGRSLDGTCWVDDQSTYGYGCEIAFYSIVSTYVAFCFCVLILFALRHGNSAGSAAVGTCHCWSVRDWFGGSQSYLRSFSLSGISMSRRPTARRASTISEPDRVALVNRMAMFTAGFLIIWMPETVYFLYRHGHRSTAAADGLGRVVAVTIPLTGFVNLVIWRNPLRALSRAKLKSGGCSSCFGRCERSAAKALAGSPMPSSANDTASDRNRTASAAPLRQELRLEENPGAPQSASPATDAQSSSGSSVIDQ